MFLSWNCADNFGVATGCGPLILSPRDDCAQQRHGENDNQGKPRY